jgi:hypothetical protein
MTALFRRFTLCLLAVGGFLGMAALLHRALPNAVPEVTPKLDYLKAHRADYDTLFVGSSRVYHGITPKVFDAVTAAAGKPTHTFNLGINGMQPPESLYVLRKALALRLPHLQRVFLEIATVGPAPDPNNLTMRDIHWRDNDALLNGLRRAFLNANLHALPGWQALGNDLWVSGLTYAQNQWNIGRLDLTIQLNKTANRLGDVMLGPASDGFLPVSHPLAPESLQTLQRNLKSMRDGTVKQRDPDPLNTEAYARIRDLLASRGIELVLISAPETVKNYHAWVDAPPGIRLLKFDDPQLHPELYVPEHRLDSDHVNGIGAQIFTRELAQAYLAGK